MYYIAEIKAPAGYEPDHTKHRFVFCNSGGTDCATCQAMIGDTNAARIPLDTIGLFEVPNQPITVELPATGGLGMAPHILCGVPLVAAPLVYGLSLRRKHERRGKK